MDGSAVTDFFYKKCHGSRKLVVCSEKRSGYESAVRDAIEKFCEFLVEYNVSP